MKLLDFLLILLVLLIASSHAFFWYEANEAEKVRLSQVATIEDKDQQLALKEAVIRELSGLLTMTSEELNQTEDRLRGEKERNDNMANQISDLVGTVSDLDKLSKTDEELLQKYSKVYFLNEHYTPSNLSDVKKVYVYNEDRDYQIHSEVLPDLEKMLDNAKEDGIDIWVVSAFRSFQSQSQLKGAYTITYGNGANTFSADQGYSEHQLGTTVDLTTTGLSGGLTRSFATTPAFGWLKDNAHKYGFTLSYPENNSFYVYEPWHWRFVGKDLAYDLYNDGKYFYDLPQRDIDKYLLHIFD